MEQGLSLTVMGMGIVFTVLFLIFLAIVILGWYEKTFPVIESSSKSGHKKKVPVTSSGLSYTDDEVAAIKGALSMHMNKKPEEFNIQIRK